MCILSFAWRTEEIVPLSKVKSTEKDAIVTPKGMRVPSYFGMRKTATEASAIMVMTRIVRSDKMLPIIFSTFDSSSDISLTAIVNKPMSAAMLKKAKNSYMTAYSP